LFQTAYRPNAMWLAGFFLWSPPHYTAKQGFDDAASDAAVPCGSGHRAEIATVRSHEPENGMMNSQAQRQHSPDALLRQKSSKCCG